MHSFRAGWTQATGGARRAAERWVDDLTADGGTNIEDALAEAFRARSQAERLSIVVFVTDGLPSVGEENPERLAAQADADRGPTRVFAFGVGHDVNTYLLDRLSAAGRGSTQYVEPGENVERALSALATKIRHPVLTDLEIADRPAELVELYPTPLPDLFAGEDLVILGRYRGERDRAGALAITGRRAGETERYATEVRFPAHARANDFIPRLWASRKLGVLSRTLRLEGPNPEIEREIRETALRYGLLSEYTSYLVQEPSEEMVADVLRSEAQRISRPQPADVQVGAGAVAAAKAARGRRDVKTEAELAEMDEALYRRQHFPQARGVAGRLFMEEDGVWVDLTHTDSMRTVSIAPYSEAYFTLVRLAPELKPYLQQLEQVVVAGTRLSFRIAEGGAETMSEAQVRRLVEAFRGQ